MSIPDPKRLKIEITRRCNARCVFCSHNPKCTDTMSVEQVCAILDDFPNVREVQPQWFGEPMCHPEFGRIIEEIKRRGHTIMLYTNASLVHKHLAAIKSLRPPDGIRVSVEGRDAATYEGIRVGLKWDRLVENVALLGEHLDPNVGFMGRITVCKEIAADIKEVIEFWRTRFRKVVTVRERPLSRKLKGGFPGRYHCTLPADHMTVKADGELCLCCVDYTGGMGLGNVFELGARQAWERSAPARHANYPFCKTCLFDWVSEEK